MAFNNVIIKGFKKAGKLIGQGFSSLFDAGRFVKFCRISDEANISQKLSTEEHIRQSISIDSLIKQNISTESGL